MSEGGAKPIDYGQMAYLCKNCGYLGNRFFKLVDDSGTYKPSYPCPCCDKVLFPVSFSDSQEEACLIIDDEGQAVDWTCPDCGSHSITQSLDEIWH